MRFLVLQTKHFFSWHILKNGCKYFEIVFALVRLFSPWREIHGFESLKFIVQLLEFIADVKTVERYFGGRYLTLRASLL